MAAFSRRMPRGERLWLNVTFIVLWLSGCLWLVLDLWFSQVGEFGATPHPWQPPLLLIHGVVAVPVVFLIGWIAARHASLKWKLQMRRRSGSILAAFLLLLAVSGFGLFFVAQESLQHVAVVTHEVAGVLVTLSILEHWFVGRAQEDEAVE